MSTWMKYGLGDSGPLVVMVVASAMPLKSLG